MITLLLAVDLPSALNTAAKPTLIASQPPTVKAQPTAPQADPQTFPYASLRLGVGFPQAYNGSFDLGGTSGTTSLNLNTGFSGELAVGYQFKQARTELAVGYGNYGVKNQSFNLGDFGGFTSGSNGNLNLTTVMVNGYYDIPIFKQNGAKSRWSPYIGAGLGYANINTPSCGSGDCFTGGSTNGFAYQGKLGISYRATKRGFAFMEGGYLGATSGSIDAIKFDNFGTWQIGLGWRQGF